MMRVVESMDFLIVTGIPSSLCDLSAILLRSCSCFCCLERVSNDMLLLFHHQDHQDPSCRGCILQHRRHLFRRHVEVSCCYDILQTIASFAVYLPVSSNTHFKLCIDETDRDSIVEITIVECACTSNLELLTTPSRMG